MTTRRRRVAAPGTRVVPDARRPDARRPDEVRASVRLETGFLAVARLAEVLRALAPFAATFRPAAFLADARFAVACRDAGRGRAVAFLRTVGF
ncbi:MAG: hypothetical protein ACXW2Y_10495, partial [Acidimicrobiia bacterium]